MFKDLRANIQQEDSISSQNSIPLTKYEETLKHKIPVHLKNYESLKEWSDLS